MSPPDTATGTPLFVVVLFPSSPWALYPQQYAAPLVVTPQVSESLVLTAVNVSPPETATGVRRSVPYVPSPSSPTVLFPQHYAAPLDVTPHV